MLGSGGFVAPGVRGPPLGRASRAVAARRHQVASSRKGDKAKAKNVKRQLANLGEPTPEDLKRSAEAAEAVYGARGASDASEDGLMESVVADRMLKRVFTFAGIPVVFGLLLFPVFWYLKVVKKVDLPMGTVFVVQSIVFGTGLLGISYGATSASWDPKIEGSSLGWNEFRANLSAIRGRVK